MILAGLFSPLIFLICLERGVHFWTLLCAIGHEKYCPVKYRAWLGSTKPFRSSGSWATQLRGWGSHGVAVHLRGSKEQGQHERLQQGKDLSWTQMWQWRHCSFPPALCPTPALAQTSPWSLAAWIHLCWHASALPESLCGPHRADWWPSRACCESQPGCSPIPLLTFGKNGDRSVSGLCPNMGLTLCTWDHRNGHRLASHTGTYTDFFFPGKTLLC